MLPDQVSNPGPLTQESDALPIALRGPAKITLTVLKSQRDKHCYTNLILPKLKTEFGFFFFFHCIKYVFICIKFHANIFNS